MNIQPVALNVPTAYTRPSVNAPAQSTFPKRMFKRLLLAFMTGPVPMLALVFASKQGWLNLDQLEVYSAGVFAYWGLLIGVLQRSLMRSLIGLNFGAGVGYLWGLYMTRSSFNSEDTKWYAALAAFALAGSALSWLCAQNREKPLRSMARGMLAGALSFLLMGVFCSWSAHSFNSDYMGLLMVVILPFWIGLFFFITFAVPKTPAA